MFYSGGRKRKGSLPIIGRDSLYLGCSCFALKGDVLRLNKYLSEIGFCSRRQADNYIKEGKLTVNGRPAEMGMQVSEDDEVLFCNKKIREVTERVILLFNKPRGIVCTTQKKDKNNIVDYIGYPIRIYPVGRLDKDSVGLIILTNDGSLVNRIMRARNHHEKEYEVRVDREVTSDFIKGMSEGVPILETVTRKCRAWKTGRRSFRIILTQGLNRQIRRMCEHFGYSVTHLKRVRIMNLKLGDLKEGSYREITKREKEELFSLLGDGE